jgi:hypothetical protein
MLILDKHKAIERMLDAAAAMDAAVPEGPGHWYSSTPPRRLARFEPRPAPGASRRPAERRLRPGYPPRTEAPPFPVF